MKIDPNLSVHLQQQNQSVQKPANKPLDQKQSESNLVVGDQVNLSADQQKADQLKTELNGLPEVRQDRVEQVRQAIQSGSYQVTDEQIAEAIISETIG